jgi:hypothetical protein
MFWSCDRTGYPVLELPRLGWAVQLFPVAKPQWERFLAEPRSLGDAWYEEVLKISPRAGVRQAKLSAYEDVFMAGIHANEAERFAVWLGSGFQIPDVDVWRAIDRSLLEESIDPEFLSAVRSLNGLHVNAFRLLDFLLEARKPHDWGDLILMRNGLLEWVRTGPKSYGGLGAPRQEFHPLLMNPQHHAPVKPLKNERLGYFGCRLVRPLAQSPPPESTEDPTP